MQHDDGNDLYVLFVSVSPDMPVSVSLAMYPAVDASTILFFVHFPMTKGLLSMCKSSPITP